MTKRTRLVSLKPRVNCPACGHFAQQPVTAVMCCKCHTPYFRPNIKEKYTIIVDMRRWLIWMMLILAGFMGAAMLIAWRVV